MTQPIRTDATGSVIARMAADYGTFRSRAADNDYMGPIADPLRGKVPFTAFVEVCEPGGATPLPHHILAHGPVFVLKGEDASICGGERIPMKAGDSFLAPPCDDHVVENTGTETLHCLTMMVPNEGFAELCRNGLRTHLPDEDLAIVTGGCGG